MFKIIHLSDLHFHAIFKYKMKEVPLKVKLGLLNYHLNRKHSQNNDTLKAIFNKAKAENPDLFIITGDLCNFGQPEEFAKIRDWLYKLQLNTEIILIPGNHDAYTPGSLKNFNKSFDKFLYSTGNYKQELQKSILKQTTIKKPLLPTFPIIRQYNEIIIIGLSSAISSPPLCAYGKVDSQQLDICYKTLKQAGAQGKTRIIAIHHPPFAIKQSYIRGLTNNNEMEEILKDAGAELVLHGHTHLSSYKQLTTKDGILPILGVSSASKTNPLKKFNSSYNLIQINENNKKLTWENKNLS